MAMVKAMAMATATRRRCGVGHFRSKAFFQMKFASNHEKGNLIKAKSRNIKLIYGSEIACEKRRARAKGNGNGNGIGKGKESNETRQKCCRRRENQIESRVAKLRNFAVFEKSSRLNIALSSY